MNFASPSTPGPRYHPLTPPTDGDYDAIAVAGTSQQRSPGDQPSATAAFLAEISYWESLKTPSPPRPCSIPNPIPSPNQKHNDNDVDIAQCVDVQQVKRKLSLSKTPAGRIRSRVPSKRSLLGLVYPQTPRRDQNPDEDDLSDEVVLICKENLSLPSPDAAWPTPRSSLRKSLTESNLKDARFRSSVNTEPLRGSLMSEGKTDVESFDGIGRILMGFDDGMTVGDDSEDGHQRIQKQLPFSSPASKGRRNRSVDLHIDVPRVKGSLIVTTTSSPSPLPYDPQRSPTTPSPIPSSTVQHHLINSAEITHASKVTLTTKIPIIIESKEMVAGGSSGDESGLSNSDGDGDADSIKRRQKREIGIWKQDRAQLRINTQDLSVQDAPSSGQEEMSSSMFSSAHPQRLLSNQPPPHQPSRVDSAWTMSGRLPTIKEDRSGKQSLTETPTSAKAQPAYQATPSQSGQKAVHQISPLQAAARTASALPDIYSATPSFHAPALPWSGRSLDSLKSSMPIEDVSRLISKALKENTESAVKMLTTEEVLEVEEERSRLLKSLEALRISYASDVRRRRRAISYLSQVVGNGDLVQAQKVIRCLSRMTEEQDALSAEISVTQSHLIRIQELIAKHQLGAIALAHKSAQASVQREIQHSKKLEEAVTRMRSRRAVSVKQHRKPSSIHPEDRSSIYPDSPTISNLVLKPHRQPSLRRQATVTKAEVSQPSRSSLASTDPRDSGISASTVLDLNGFTFPAPPNQPPKVENLVVPAIGVTEPSEPGTDGSSDDHFTLPRRLTPRSASVDVLILPPGSEAPQSQWATKPNGIEPVHTTFPVTPWSASFHDHRGHSRYGSEALPMIPVPQAVEDEKLTAASYFVRASSRPTTMPPTHPDSPSSPARRFQRGRQSVCEDPQSILLALATVQHWTNDDPSEVIQ